MITKELLDFIKGERAKGFSDGAIKKMLTNNGWKEADVDEAYNSLSGKVVQSGTPPKVETSPAQPASSPAMQAKPNIQPKPEPKVGPKTETKFEAKLSPSDEPKGEIDFSKIKTANKPQVEAPNLGVTPKIEPKPQTQPQTPAKSNFQAPMEPKPQPAEQKKPEPKPIKINPNKTTEFKPVFQPIASPVNEANIEAEIPEQKSKPKPITMSNLGVTQKPTEMPKKKSGVKSTIIIILIFVLVWVAGAYFLHREGVINLPFLAPVERPAPEPIPTFKDLNDQMEVEDSMPAMDAIEEDEMSASPDEEAMDLEEGAMEEENIAVEAPVLTRAEAEELVYAKWGDCNEPGTCGGVLVSLYQAGDIYSVSAIYNNYDDSIAFTKRTAEALYQDGVWTLVNEEQTWACHQGRGHQDFSTELCL